jgi:OmcA/MtrC family decaheme c-type cytochrome
VKYFDLLSKNRSSYHWINFAAASLLVAALAGCGGSSGGGDNTAAAPAAGGGGGGGGAAPVVAAPTGTAPITLTAATPAATFAALTPAVPAVAVTINSPPKVTFSVTDGAGNAIIGLGSKSQSATATVASYPNISFALAKLVPGTGTAPSRWVSYLVTTVPTYTSATDHTIVASVPTRPTTDNAGTLVDNGNGTYTYTFYRDVKQAAAQVAAATLTAPNVAADLDDLTFDPNLVHRLTIQISGNAPGTGTNTPDGSTSAVAAVPMLHPVNVVYDFIPATGQQVTASGRDIVATAKCNACHNVLGGIPGDTATNNSAAFHGGSRNDARYCVVCHTGQRKYGQAEATTTATGYSGNTYRINGFAVGKLPTHIHKIHMGSDLTKTGYNYANVLYNKITYSQDVKNCTTCHDGTPGAANATAQGDNWKSVPSREACGACHDGINFATGKGWTLADFEAGTQATSIGHVGGAKADDSQCALCHDATTIPTYHYPVTPPNPANSLLLGGTNANTNAAWIASNPGNLPAGAIGVTYDLKSVSRNASKNPVIVFRILQNGARADFNTYSATGKTEIWDNFMGSPSLYWVYAVPQDGITAPADFNASTSVYLRSVWNGTVKTATLSAPDSSGYYTVTVTNATIPDSAVMLTGGVGYTYGVVNTLPLTQTNVSGYPVKAATATTGLTAGMPNMTGGLLVLAPDAQSVASAGAAAGGTGGAYTGRRPIVDNAQCEKCHQKLGPFTGEAFHAGQRNNGTTCSWCHTANNAVGGWAGDSTSFIHGIHAAAKRTVPFTFEATSATDGFFNVTYPGRLKQCTTCHLSGTFDFSAAASASALPNRLYRTTAYNAISTTTTYLNSPYVTAGTNYGAPFSFSAVTGVTTPAAVTNLVNSPIAAACFSCHDSTLDVSHMVSNGGSLNAPRSTAMAVTEQCTLCHLAGKVADIAAMHAK